MRASLERAYLRTTYLVQGPRGPIRLRAGQRSRALERLLGSRQARSWTFITACNPGSRPPSRWRNAARHTGLLRELWRACYRSLPGWGIPDSPAWKPERSMLVLNVSPAAAMRLGRRFGQNAVLLGRAGGRSRLAWCDRSGAGH